MLIIESIILCLLFTIIVYIMTKNPIKMLYNYPPKIQERVKKINKNQVPTNKTLPKIIFIIIAIFVFSIILKYINGYKTFNQSFKNTFILWTIVNTYDLIVLDIIWFCHDKHFILKGTEDMTKEYHNYKFHIKEFLIGEILGIIVSLLTSIIIKII